MLETAQITRTKNKVLLDWVKEVVKLVEPDQVIWCDGSENEQKYLTQMLVDDGVFVPLSGRFKGSYLVRSHPEDVARSVQDTHICTPKDSGPLTNWWEANEAKADMQRRFSGCMRGRTMYVIPFSMGPLGSELAHIGIQITDSPYVVLNTRIMARMGQEVLDELGPDGKFIKCLHSVGVPLKNGQKDALWPCNPDIRKICHFPQTREVWSIGSGYGGNALLGKKCFALRIATAMAREEGWMAEHMMILRLTEQATGRHWHIAAAFPSACGKTNLAMLQPTIPGYKVTTIGDDIAWMRPDSKGRLRAINPEAGFFGVAPGTGPGSNNVALKAILKGSIHTNVAHDPETGEAWWEGLTDDAPPRLIDWQGQEWTPSSGRPSSHPNARFTTPYSQCDTADVAVWDDPAGVPIDLILFGGRRPDTIPLVRLARNWDEGVMFGATVSSARTAAAEGQVGEVTHDMFAMAPFFGYRVTDYVRHWLEIGRKIAAKHGEQALPRIGYVNWFRQDKSGHYMWPGFGENSRVLDVLIRAIKGEIKLNDTPAGLVPAPSDFNRDGLEVSDKDLKTLLNVDPAAWQQEAAENLAYLTKTFGKDFPSEITSQLEVLAREKTSTAKKSTKPDTKQKIIV